MSSPLEKSAAEPSRRGRLTVFFGALPGVGKSHSLQRAAQDAVRQGLTVVTATAAEDIDAIAARHPGLVLCEDMALQNPEGARHLRRYNDLLDLLDAGIDVYSTLNVLQLESAQDLVHRLGLGNIRNTVPDRWLERIDDLVLVDVVPTELMSRFHGGRIRIPPEYDIAPERLFRPDVLAALRELALRTLSHRLDKIRQERDLPDTARASVTSGESRLLLAIGPGEDGIQLVRAAHRLSESSAGRWTVLHIDTREPGQVMEAGLHDALNLARKLGADTVVQKGVAIASEILEYARGHRVQRILLGKPSRWNWRKPWRRSVAPQVSRYGARFEIVLLPRSDASAPSTLTRPPHKAPPFRIGRDLVIASGIMLTTTGIAWIVSQFLSLPNVLLVFLSGVLTASAMSRIGPAVWSAAWGFLAYNFLFTEPLYSFDINQTEDLLTGLFFLAIALVTGNLTARLRLQLLAAREGRQNIESLLSLSRQLAAAPDPASIMKIACDHLQTAFRATIAFFLPDTRGALHLAASSEPRLSILDEDWRAAGWTLAHGRDSGWYTETHADARFWLIPLKDGDTTFGVMGLMTSLEGRLSSAQRRRAETLVTQIAQSLHRSRLVEDLESTRLRSETEQLRSALLSSISHDLRTPLTSMIGSISSLLDQEQQLSSASRRELLQLTLEEAERLNRYIQNLLDMTRLGSGGLKIQRDWVALPDLVAGALQRLQAPLAALHVQLSLPANLPLLYVHAALIEQALINLLENAARFAPAGSTLIVQAAAEGSWMRLDIVDEGPGIPEEERQHLFQLSANRSDRGGAGGLGLSICRGMIGAHGGSVEALAGPEGRGTCMRIRLPLPDARDIPPGPE